jgi:preprotein translocase subunit SecY
VFALGIMPYISASIFAQIAGAVVPTVDKMQKDEEGRKKLNAVDALPDRCCWRRAGLRLRAVHAVAAQRGGAPGLGLRLSMVLVPGHGRDVRHVAGRADHRARPRQRCLAADLLLDHRAVLAGIIQTFSFVSTVPLAPLALWCSACDGRRGRRRGGDHGAAAGRVMVQIPQRTMARGRMREATEELHPAPHQHGGRDADHLRAVGDRDPGRVAQFSGSQRGREIAAYLRSGTWLYFVLSAILIVVFTYFYTSIIFNPVDLAEN